VAAANYTAGAVSIYEMLNPSNRFALVGHPNAACPAFSPDGRWIASGNWKGAGIKVWEFESKRVAFQAARPVPAWVTFSPDNHWLLVGGAAYELIETGTWTLKRTIPRTGPETAPAAMAFSPDAQLMAIVPNLKVIQLFDPEKGELLARLEAPQLANISYLRFSPDGSKLFALEWDQQIQVWDLGRTREELRKLNLDWLGRAGKTLVPTKGEGR
jgi:WD40 repeat protein